MTQTAPACPRCGYDQSGIVATWEQAAPPMCPLGGVCSECGLEFAWADLMSPARARVPGLFEHAAGPVQSVRWALRTWAMTLRPRRFWMRVRLESPVRPVRAALWPVLLAAAAWAAGSLLWNAPSLPRGFGAAWTEEWAEVANGWMRPVAFVWPAGGSWAPRWTPDAPGWLGIFAPIGAMALMWGVLMLVLPSTLRAARVRRAHVLRATAYSLAWAPLAGVIHAADALWYVFQLYTPGSFWLPDDRPSDHLRAVWLQALLMLTLWLMLWWRSTLRTGFRLREWRWIWRVLTVPAVLAWAAAFLFSKEGSFWLARLLV